MSEVGEAAHPAEDDEMMNMFASVWVKVEVEEEDTAELENDALADKDITYSPSKKKRVRDRPKKFKCGDCDYATPYKNCLKIHIMAHTNAKPLSCDDCGYTTKYQTSMNRHMKIQHQGKIGKEAHCYKCDQCSYSSFFKWNLNAHKRKHNLEKQFKCELCDYQTAYRHNYNKHKKVHNKQDVGYRCDKCPFETKFEGHITRHLAKIHNEVSETANKCDLCDFSTKVKWRLNLHKQRSLQKAVLKCMFCEFETLYMCESKRHKLVHCDEVFSRPKDSGTNGTQEMDNSMSEPVSESMLPVNFLESTSSQDIPYQTTHERNNHYILDPNCEVEWNSIQVFEHPNTERPFQCMMCKYTSRFKASVQRHYQRRHTALHRPYKCTNCGFTTKTKDQISLHGKRSLSKTVLMCNTCTFTTFFKCQYANHLKGHYDHKCSLCDYVCKHKYEIQKHYFNAHMGKPLQCRFCDYKTSRKAHLACHETVHTGMKPFKCTECGYMSLRKSLLENHMRRIHGGVKYNTTVLSENKIQSLKTTIRSSDVNFQEPVVNEINNQ